MPRTPAGRAVVPPAFVTAVGRIRARRRELEALNGEATDVTQGHLVGLVEAEAYILEAICDAAGDPASPL